MLSQLCVTRPGFYPPIGSGLALILVRDRAGLRRHHFNFSAAFLVYDELAHV